MRLALPEDLRLQVLAEARAAFPRECCGLIIGVRVLGARGGPDAHALALFPARNAAALSDRFEIDPADHFAALRTARAGGQAIIGCYHSHPNGIAVPSSMDLLGAGEEGFLWLIAGKDELRAYVYLRGEFTGADLVTSSS
jgi:proteasome lid subunit RPN8/RPN11